jgi:aryl-alcohol dehydrogenase (NADP+)
MQYVNLGRTGLKVSRLCLGAMSYGTPTEADFAVAAAAERVAARKGVQPAQVALSWLLAQPGVTAPIVGATRMEHLEQVVAALDVVLDEPDRAELESPYVPHRVLGHS